MTRATMVRFTAPDETAQTHSRNEPYQPAFRDLTTGRVEIARFRDGGVAPIHLTDGLPPDWGESCRPDGSIRQMRADVIAGYVRGGRFYTREEVVNDPD